MTETVNYRSCILDDGKFAIEQALVQGKKIRPYNFTVGDAYNFPPISAGPLNQGNIVYSGSQSLIVGSIVSKDTFQFTVTIPESAGGFTLGNIVLNVQSDDGTIFPFLWFVSKVPYPKEVLASAGSRLVITFVQKIINADDALELTIQPPQYFSLASYSTESEIPTPSAALFQQFMVQEPAYSPVPVMAARRTIDNRHWGMPLYSRLDEPFFGVIDGGRVAEPRSKPYVGRYFWGGKLSMEAGLLPFNYGGSKLSEQTLLTNIGGEPLPPYRMYRDDREFLNGEFIWGGRLEFPDYFFLTNFGCNLTDSPENTFGGIKLPTSAGL